MNITLHNGFYVSASSPLSAQLCTNYYPNIPQVEGALNIGSLIGTPGISQDLTTGNATEINRGSHTMNGTPYFVNGETLYQVNRSVVLGVEVLTNVALGTIGGYGRISSADNGKQLMIIAEGEGYIWDGTDFNKILDSDFKANGKPEHVVYIDSFFLITTDQKKLIKSDHNNGLSYNALQFTSAESDPDPIESAIVFKNQIYVAGSETMEVFENVGGVGFNFSRTGFFIDKGVSAPFSMIKAPSAFMFIGAGENESPAIWSYSGGAAPDKISNTAIDSIISKMSDAEIKAAFAWSYADSGAYFVGFSFNSRTFVYDTITAKWHERTSQINNHQSAWRVNSIVSAYDRILVADKADGRIGTLSLDTYDEYGVSIQRTFSTHPFYNESNAFSVLEVEAILEAGVGSATTNPQIRLSASHDGGVTFTSERSRGFGKIGNRERRTIWRQLGRFARNSVLKFEVSGDVKPAFLKLEAKVSV